MVPGTCLRQARERLGLTYRDVEHSSYEIAQRRGRPEFIVRVSRLADIENGGVTPSLHKLYTLCAVYHLDVSKVCGWYDVPLHEQRRDALNQSAPKTHPWPMERTDSVACAGDSGFARRQTELVTENKETLGPLGAGLVYDRSRFQLAFIGTDDHWMEPLLRPGALVLVDPNRRRVENSGWHNQFERPIYFVEVRDGYRCCWCSRERERLILQPHPLSPCIPETPKFPDEAEIVGQVAGLAMRLFAT
ncbi:MAG: hypothetical protein ACRD4S_07430 [Candidatus Acidiferrales bacterium]